MQSRHAGAIILAGGRGRRLARDKGLLPIGGMPIVERVVRAAQAAVGEVVVVGEVCLPRGWGVLVVADETPGGGPAHGLWVGLRALKQPIAVLVAWDMPFVTAGLLGYLVEALQASPNDQAAVPRLDGRPQPLCAAYRKSCTEILERLQRGVNVPMKHLLAHLRIRWIDAEALSGLGEPEKLLFNVNTPQDLKLAQYWAIEA